MDARTRDLNALNGSIESHALAWKLLQAYVGRAISVRAIGKELVVRFGSDIEAQQMASFIRPWDPE